MNFKINNSSSVKKADKSKKSSKASGAEGLGFASALDQAKGVNDIQETQVATSVESISGFVLDEGNQVPTEAKQRGYYILDLLEELEQDILAGKQTAVISKLEEALSTDSLDKESLPPVVSELMDEIDARAQIELEKLKS